MKNNSFNLLVKNEEMKVYQRFIINNNDWYYGITKNNFNNSQLFIMTPYETSLLTSEDIKSCCIVYLDIPDNIRKNRLLIREDSNDSIDRRISSDNFDFRNFDRYDIRVTDNNFDPKMIWDLMF
jgi:guanylate kinase